MAGCVDVLIVVMSWSSGGAHCQSWSNSSAHCQSWKYLWRLSELE